MELNARKDKEITRLYWVALNIFSHWLGDSHRTNTIACPKLTRIYMLGAACSHSSCFSRLAAGAAQELHRSCAWAAARVLEQQSDWFRQPFHAGKRRLDPTSLPQNAWKGPGIPPKGSFCSFLFLRAQRSCLNYSNYTNPRKRRALQAGWSSKSAWAGETPRPFCLSSLPQAFHVTAHYYFISILLGTSELSKPHQPGNEIAKGGGWNSKSAWSDRSNPSISWEYHSVSSFLPKSLGRVNAFDLRVSFLSFIWWRVQTLVTHREDWPQSPNKMALQIGPGSSQSESYNAAASTNLRLSLLKARCVEVKPEGLMTHLWCFGAQLGSSMHT